MKSVKHFMVDAEWKQADLANRLGVHYSYASLMLAGKRVPSVQLLQKLAGITKIPIATLIAEAGKPPRRTRRTGNGGGES